MGLGRCVWQGVWCAVILYRAVSLSSIFSTTLSEAAKVVVLGTGGTIAGTGHDTSRPWAYDAARLGVDDLIGGVPALAPLQKHVLCEQVAQVDSKDMGWPVWQALAAALTRHLADPDVLGVVITHGTDTLEETAALLHWLAPATKPIVLTAAMRPATAADADGPGNLADAVATVLLAHRQRQAGVVAVMQGRVWSARHVRKAHSHAVDAFDGGGEAPLLVAAPGELGQLDITLPMAAWPRGLALGFNVMASTPAVVPLLTSHADADGLLVRALLAMPSGRPRGLLVACTGHGTLHQGLSQALQAALQAGVMVWRSSRVARGGVTPRSDDSLPATGHWTAAQARLGLQLKLMGAPLDLSRGD
jgi:L-asparaginase